MTKEIKELKDRVNALQAQFDSNGRYPKQVTNFPSKGRSYEKEENDAVSVSSEVENIVQKEPKISPKRPVEKKTDFKPDGKAKRDGENLNKNLISFSDEEQNIGKKESKISPKRPIEIKTDCKTGGNAAKHDDEAFPSKLDENLDKNLVSVSAETDENGNKRYQNQNNFPFSTGIIAGVVLGIGTGVLVAKTANKV